MIAAIIAGITLLGQLVTIGVRIWDAVKENDVEIKKQKTEAIQSAARAVIDRDVSRLNVAINDIERLRGK